MIAVSQSGLVVDTPEDSIGVILAGDSHDASGT